jgi:hypothetical protein
VTEVLASEQNALISNYFRLTITQILELRFEAMSQSAFRSSMCICYLLAIFLPAQMMLAEETATAMLYTTGAAWLNGTQVPKSAAVYSGDGLQTGPDSLASIQLTGSRVTVQADSFAKFEGPAAVQLDHGTVRVMTSRGFATRVGDLTIKPATNAWSEFQVTDVNGLVQIAANKGDLLVQDDKGTTTVAQGQQTTRDDTVDSEKKKNKPRRRTPAPSATGGMMSSKAAIGVGLGVVAGVGIWVGLQDEPPISPACRAISCQ